MLQGTQGRVGDEVGTSQGIVSERFCKGFCSNSIVPRRVSFRPVRFRFVPFPFGSSRLVSFPFLPFRLRPSVPPLFPLSHKPMRGISKSYMLQGGDYKILYATGRLERAPRSI